MAALDVKIGPLPSRTFPHSIPAREHQVADHGRTFRDPLYTPHDTLTGCPGSAKRSSPVDQDCRRVKHPAAGSSVQAGDHLAADRTAGRPSSTRPTRSFSSRRCRRPGTASTVTCTASPSSRHHALQVSQLESRPSGTERYLRLVHPVVRGCQGIVVAVAVFSAAGAIGGRGGLALAGFPGQLLPAELPAVPGGALRDHRSWLDARRRLGFAAAASHGPALSWYGVTGESIAADAICILGYGLEREVAARTGRRALRKDRRNGEARRS
jgi:hypothetical protein